MGRPLLPREKRKSHAIQAYCSDEELDALDLVRQIQDVSRGEVLRRALREYAGRVLAEQKGGQQT
jgi:hypothetical protein